MLFSLCKLNNLIMKNLFKSTVVLLCFVMPIGIFSFNSDTDITSKIAEAFKNGSSSELAKYFNSNIEMEMLGEENMYSKAQAEILMKDFFSKNKPASFKINHHGSKAATSFAIGNLITANGAYRISIFMKSDNGKTLIHQLRIERSEETM